MNDIAQIFADAKIDETLLNELENVQEPRSRYFIAITPRSGSTYLCDVIKNTKRMGRPQEILGASAIANRLAKNMPARTPEQYLRNALRVTQTHFNHVSGLKASWFQFENFLQVVKDDRCLQGFKFIYLTRRDLAAQAVSLYKATSSDIFFSNVPASEESVAKLAALDYDFTSIKYWYDHIIAQEKGWQRYFYENRIYPCCLTYEEIEDDVLRVVKRMAYYVGVQPDNIRLPPEVSELQVLRDERSREWALRFQNQLALKDCH